MILKLHIETMETKIWKEYIDTFKDESKSLIDSFWNGTLLSQIFEKKNKQNDENEYLKLNAIVKMLNVEKQMYDWSFHSLKCIVDENCRVIRENVIYKTPPKIIEDCCIKINTNTLIEALSYACV